MSHDANFLNPAASLRGQVQDADTGEWRDHPVHYEHVHDPGLRKSESVREIALYSSFVLPTLTALTYLLVAGSLNAHRENLQVQHFGIRKRQWRVSDLLVVISAPISQNPFLALRCRNTDGEHAR